MHWRLCGRARTETDLNGKGRRVFPATGDKDLHGLCGMRPQAKRADKRQPTLRHLAGHILPIDVKLHAPEMVRVVDAGDQGGAKVHPRAVIANGKGQDTRLG